MPSPSQKSAERGGGPPGHRLGGVGPVGTKTELPCETYLARARGGRSYPGYHRRKGVPGIIGPGEARGVVITSIRRGVWPGVGIHCTPRFPFRKLATVKNVPEHRSGPSRSDVWRTNLAYRINYTSDGMDSKSQSHTQSNQKVPYHPGQNTPGITKRGQARGAAHPGYHDSGACPQVRRSQ